MPQHDPTNMLSNEDDIKGAPEAFKQGHSALSACDELLATLESVGQRDRPESMEQ